MSKWQNTTGDLRWRLSKLIRNNFLSALLWANCLLWLNYDSCEAAVSFMVKRQALHWSQTKAFLILSIHHGENEFLVKNKFSSHFRISEFAIHLSFAMIFKFCIFIILFAELKWRLFETWWSLAVCSYLQAVCSMTVFFFFSFCSIWITHLHGFFFFLPFNAVKSIIVCLVQFMSHCVPFPFLGTVVLMITRNNAFSIYTVCMGLMRNYRLGSFSWTMYQAAV